MEQLIPAINKLQSVFNTVTSSKFDANLPQIVVVGDQSAGKSSVLESLVTRTCLPRGADIVTRCPIVLQLTQLPAGGKRIPASANESSESSKGVPFRTVTEYVEFPHLPEGHQIVEDFEKIPGIINEEVTIRAGGSKNIIDQELIMKVYSTDVITLTVVDLPGIVRNVTAGQPANIIERINALLMKYIGNENSIILAVSSAANDIATSASISLARQVDPELDRTVAVITKLDLMDKGLDATSMLEGETLLVKLGIVGVVNRSFQDTEKGVTIAESLEKEEAYLQKHYPNIAEKHGGKYLAKILQRTLMNHIKLILPNLTRQLKSKLEDSTVELKTLGDDVPVDKGALLMSLIGQVCENYKSEITGTATMSSTDELSGRALIGLTLDEKLASKIPDVSLRSKDILITIRNSKPLDSSMILTEKSFQNLAAGQVSRLQEPAENCAEEVREELVSILEKSINKLGTKIRRFPALTDAIRVEVLNLLDANMKVAVDELMRYVETEASFIKTSRPDFNEAAQAFFRKRHEDAEEDKEWQMQEKESKLELSRRIRSSGTLTGKMLFGLKLTYFEKEQCNSMKTLVTKYYEIVKDAFLDHCPKVISRSIIYDVMQVMQDTLISKLHDPERLGDLILEEGGVTEKRKHLRAVIAALEKANVVIRDIQRIRF